jgi:hypothetical protein
MTTIHLSTALLLTFSLCQGCASGREYRVPVHLASNTDIAIVQARAHAKVAGFIVGGDVRRPNSYAGVVPGYLHIVGRDGSSRVVATTNTHWGEFMNRRFRLAYFKAFLPVTDPSTIKEITIEPITGQRP